MKENSPNCNKIESPKTPAGISKSLLTPCRRLGLSRKWKKGGCSPFVSPLSNQSTTPENRDTETKKRKTCDEREIVQDKKEAAEKVHISDSRINTPGPSESKQKSDDINTTPFRNSLPRKKAKINSLKNKLENNKDELSSSQENSNKYVDIESQDRKDSVSEEKIITINNDKELCNSSKEEVSKPVKLASLQNLSKPVKQASLQNVSKPVRVDSKGKSKLSLKRSNSKSSCNVPKETKSRKTCEPTKIKEKSPNNLTKECIVVIQNKIFKSDQENVKNTKPEEITHEQNTIAQESDSEPDISLKKDTIENVTLNTLNDNDFICKPSEAVPKKHRNLSIKKQPKISSNESSQEDTDKKTILIKKTYDKVTMPLKAKSTGSITQKDIDELRARIEKKKKLLMAKAMSIETEELRELIKKWQKGCQDALMELLELMKKQIPDRQNMDYAEILKALKIPPELVGYDSDNECFLTPDDNNILLSTFKL